MMNKGISRRASYLHKKIHDTYDILLAENDKTVKKELAGELIVLYEELYAIRRPSYKDRMMLRTLKLLNHDKIYQTKVRDNLRKEIQDKGL